MSVVDGAKRWNAITSLATLGTSRSSPSLDALWPDAAFVMPGAAPESTLLRIAAANYLWQLSGTRARSEPVPPLDAAPELEAKLVSEAAAWRMCRMLNGEHRELLAEWFSLAARADRVLAPQWVPVVMDVVKQPELASVIPVLGRRAAWLAARNPEWKLRDSTASPSEERWSNGTLDERLAELAALRALDPAAARGWVEKTWGVDPPDAREAFVRVLMIGVSADDEPFLETALDDKRKAVRAAAAGCLARLPQSAYVRRSLERLEPLMVLDPVRSGLIGKLKKRRLQVQLPVTLDKATLRDGLDASPPASRKIGERAWWLVQMVSIAPPSHWTQRFTCDVETFIEAVEDTEYGSDLMSALTEAAIRHVDDVWLAALCRHFVSKNPSAEAADALDTTILKIVRAAPIASRATLLAQTLHSIDESRFGLAHVLLSGSDCDWSTDTTRAAFALLEKRIRGDSQQWAHARNTLTEWGRHANVEIALAEIERLHAKCPDKSPWRNAIEAVREIIEFRAAMRQELLT